MQGEAFRGHSSLKDLVAEATRSLSHLDADRLEELAMSCRALNRDLQHLDEGDRTRLAADAREATGDLAVLGRVLEATRANLRVMNRLQELRSARLEYRPLPEQPRKPTEGPHGDN